MNRAVYRAQCRAWKVAQELTGQFADAVPGSLAERPPYCLHLLRPYRTASVCAFRKAVADELRRRRGAD